MRLHHIAYVTEDVVAKAKSLGGLLGITALGEPVSDEEQQVKVLFLDLGNGAKLELLEPLGPASPVQRHLEKGGGLYHLCFEVDNLDETLKKVQEDGQAMMVKEPVCAPAIGEQRVAFVVTRDMDLVEFVQAVCETKK
ncbi:VOC family protein [Planctomycetota bacterium]